MSDTLKDQLLKAGFAETPRAANKRSGKNQPGKKTAGKSTTHKKSTGKSTEKPRHGTQQQHTPNKNQGAAARNNGKRHSNAENLEVIAEKKRVKAAIKELIENNAIKDSTGEIAYSYLLGARVKQIFVKKEVLEKLAADELVITRLNGGTHIINPELVDQILALNAEWAIIRNDAKTTSAADKAEGYENYQIPDDLMW